MFGLAEQKVCIWCGLKKWSRSATLQVFTCTGYGRAEPCFLKSGSRVSDPCLLTTLFASHLNEERLIGFALLGPRRKKLTDTTMHARAKVRAQPLTGSECLEGGDLTPGRLIVCTAFRLNLPCF